MGNSWTCGLSSCSDERLVRMRPFAELSERGRILRLRQLAVQAVADDYQLANADVRLLSTRSFNTIFRVTAQGGRYALRVGDACRIHIDGVEDVEAEWLDALAADSISAPVNTPAADTRRWITVSHTGVPEARICSMFTWLDGRPLRERLSEESMMGAGALLAKLHDHAASFVGTTRVPASLHADRVVYFHEENRVRSYRSSHGNLFVDALDRLQHELDQLWRAPPHPPHLLHGDFGSNNVLSWRNKLFPIDFQDLQFGFDVQDVGLSLADLRRSKPELVESFTTGYVSVRPWPELSPSREAAFSAARSLNVMNVGLHLRRSGIAEFLDGHARRVASWMASS